MNKEDFDKMMILDLSQIRITSEYDRIQQNLTAAVILFINNNKESLEMENKRIINEFPIIDFYFEENGIVVGYECKTKYFSLAESDTTFYSFRLSYKEVFGWEIDFTKKYKLSDVMTTLQTTFKKS